jgi:FkbM family methyltransferase
MSFVSHAQNFEDVMLWRSLGHVSKGFYIDVGAMSPELDSVTKGFYDNGWSGINIEPNPEFFGELIRLRGRDINIAVAVGAEEGASSITFFRGTGLSTLDESIASLHRNANYEVAEAKVEIRTLSSIWQEHVPPSQEVHFLKIDVEGFEKQVLQGNDWLANRPWVIIVEAHEPNSQVESHEKWEHLLTGARYGFAYADGLNRFYLADEHVELLASFRYPPNVFDAFRSAHSESLTKKNQEAEVRAQEAEAEVGALIQSRTWRLTEPLRNAFAKMREFWPQNF